MSDIKLFRTAGAQVTELTGTSVALTGTSVAIEKELQTLLERHLETFLGVRFLASEFETGRTSHRGRIDTLGIDENGCPVIIELKRTKDENVINQGLFYLDWLLDHRAEFTMLAMRNLGSEIESAIDWSSPRLLCIAADFNRYDEHAVAQMNRNIELIRYRRFDDEFLILELVNATTAATPVEPKAKSTTRSSASKSVSEYLTQSTPELQDLFDDLDAYCSALGDDVQRKTLKLYFAYKRIKNFACVEVHPVSNGLVIYAKVDPDTVRLEPGFTRDVRDVGHFGTGDLEIRISDHADLDKARALIASSYEIS